MTNKCEKLREIRDMVKSRGKSINDFIPKGKFHHGDMTKEESRLYLAKNLTPEDYMTPELNDMSLPQLRYKLTESIRLRLGYHTTTPKPLTQEKYKLLFSRGNCPPPAITDELLARISGKLLSNTDFYYMDSKKEIAAEIDKIKKAV